MKKSRKPSSVKSFTGSLSIWDLQPSWGRSLPGLSCPGLFLLLWVWASGAGSPGLSCPVLSTPRPRCLSTCWKPEAPFHHLSPLCYPLLTPLPARPPVTLAPGPSLGRETLEFCFVWFYHCISVALPKDTHILKYRRLFVLSIYIFFCPAEKKYSCSVQCLMNMVNFPFLDRSVDVLY